MASGLLREALSPAVRKWQGLLQSRDWREIAVPYMKAQVEMFTKMLRTPENEREKKWKVGHSNDYLCGVIDAFEHLMSDPQSDVNAELTELVQNMLAASFDITYEGLEGQGQPLSNGE